MPGSSVAPQDSTMILWYLVAAAMGALVASGFWYWDRRRLPHIDPHAADERVVEVSELAGGLAHELRNPLSTVMLNLRLLNEDLSESVEADADALRRCRQRVKVVLTEADRLSHLLDDFLRLIGSARLETRSVDLSSAVEHVVRSFRPRVQADRIRVLAEFTPDPLPCALDERIFAHALLNILLNAQQAMPEGGEILLRTMRAAPSRAALEISDTGCGMPPEVQRKAFVPFYSTKPRGSGLGLATTRRIVAEHGGDLKLFSEPGKGTSFTISLPLVPDTTSGHHRDSAS